MHLTLSPHFRASMARHSAASSSAWAASRRSSRSRRSPCRLQALSLRYPSRSIPKALVRLVATLSREGLSGAGSDPTVVPVAGPGLRHHRISAAWSVLKRLSDAPQACRSASGTTIGLRADSFRPFQALRYRSVRAELVACQRLAPHHNAVEALFGKFKVPGCYLPDAGAGHTPSIAKVRCCVFVRETKNAERK